MVRRTFKLKVRVKGCDIEFAERLGPGVLASQEATWELESEEEFTKWPFLNGLIEMQNELVSEVIEVQLEEVTGG